MTRPFRAHGTRKPAPAVATTRGGASWFLVGDGLFLILVSCMGTGAMHMMHEVGWGFVLECLSGMVLAMLLAMLMALAVAPVLGSIESMVPAMVISMLSPMSVSALDLFGVDSDAWVALVLGITFGVGMFAFVQAYGASCRAAFRRGATDRGRTR
jgi:hypothetical protein